MSSGLVPSVAGAAVKHGEGRGRADEAGRRAVSHLGLAYTCSVGPAEVVYTERVVGSREGGR